MLSIKTTTIDEFIAGYPGDIQALLEQIRITIKTAAPAAIEKISYGIPTFVLNGNLVHFSGYKNHIGFYPGASAIIHFEKELSKYNCSKGTVQFPLEKKLPLSLITKMVKFRVKENRMKAELKKNKIY